MSKEKVTKEIIVKFVVLNDDRHDLLFTIVPDHEWTRAPKILSGIDYRLCFFYVFFVIRKHFGLQGAIKLSKSLYDTLSRMQYLRKKVGC